LLDVWLPAVLLVVAFDRIQPPAFAVGRLADAVCVVGLLLCMMQPVTVMLCELLAERFDDVCRDELRVVPVCAPLLVDGVDRVVGCWSDGCGYVCAEAATANDNTAAAHVLPAIHLCIYALHENSIRNAAGCCNADARSSGREEFCRRNQLAGVAR